MSDKPAEARPKPSNPPVKHSADVLQEVVADLKNLNFREEIVPLDASVLQAMRRDFVFWSAVVLAVVPLVPSTTIEPCRRQPHFNSDISHGHAGKRHGAHVITDGCTVCVAGRASESLGRAPVCFLERVVVAGLSRAT